MTRRPLRKLSAKPILHAEEVDSVLAHIRAELNDIADVFIRAAEERDESADQSDASDSIPATSRVPNLADRADAELRAWLEEETLALVEPEGPRGIEQHEYHHEILKKALAGLKREALNDVVRAKGLIPDSKLDDLARQVGLAYDWNEPAIARLVLDYTEEPRETAGGPLTRIFALTKPADLDYMAERLKYVDGRYYRTDIAKWFVFQQYRRVGSVLRVSGALQSYRATVDPDDEKKLATHQDIEDARLEVREASETVLVHDARTHSMAKSMLAAFKVATLASPRAYVPNAGTDAAILPGRLHPNTVFLLDLITNRLQGHLFRERNPILARFKYANRIVSESATTASRKPSLSAVRFEGENLLDSTTACGLMWTEGRPLVDVTLSVLATVSETDKTIRARVPIRVAIEKDAVLVSTGLVTSDVQVVGEIHRLVVEQVEAAMTQGVASERVTRLEAIIKDRALQADPEADAQLMVDEPDGEIGRV